MNVTHVPVLIVGAGAAGLTMSALLAKHEIPSLVVEKRREVFLYPKARNLSFRSLEILRGLGIADDVHAVAEGISSMVVKPTLGSAEQRQALDLDTIFGGLSELSPEPPAQYCPQSSLEPMLLAYTRQRGNEARYGTELTSFEQDDSGVTAVLRDVNSEELETLRADYLVAADGVHSSVRQTLGVSTSGYGALPIYVVFIYFRAPWRQIVGDLADGDAIQVENVDVNGIFLVVTGDLGMFISTYFPDKGETAAQFTPQRCRELIVKAVGQDFEDTDVQIVEVAAWQPHEQVANQFQCGRVFLVGDSAHTMPPFKAGGANAAIQSAHNLAWKLAAVVKGMAEPSLLATYHDERHPVGSFSARQSLTGPPVAFLGLDRQTPELPVDDEVPMFNLLVGYQYRSAAVLTGDRASTDPNAVLLVDELRGQPGTRVPHAWVRRDGRRVSTLDLLGPGFTVLAGDRGAAWDTSAAYGSARLGVPITVHHVGSKLGLAPDGALLVRPDDFVGWRADSMPADPQRELCRAVSAILGRG
jgi:2-polyprenyl-6-methoxyphenol hydroxylase-like FAD-dependent oxidoreductase